MRNYRLLIPLFASLAAASGCTQTECATGTIERDGKCQPSTAQSDPGSCGPGTELHGDICEPSTTPTKCDPATTEEQTNPDGTITCIGTGGGGCDTPIVCPNPMGGKLTICGQIYDFETNAKFADSPTSAGNCDANNPATSGPCALQILTYDAYAFGNDPMNAPKLPVDSVTIDKCGRYKVAGIDTNGTSPFIGLGFDDANMALGPAGVTVTVGVAAAKAEGPVIQGLEAFVVKASTTGLWQTSGGPPLLNGIYAAVFRKHKKANGDQFENQPGAVITHSNTAIPTTTTGTCTGASAVQCAFNFLATDLNHQTIDPNLTMTGMSGSTLVTKAAVSELTAYSGTGGLGTGCKWESHAAASLPGIVFIQVFRKVDGTTGTCND